MSWTEDFSGLAGTLDGPGADVYARGAILTAGAGAGASGASVLRALRSARVGMRTADFYEVYGGVKAQYQAGQTSQSLSVDGSTGEILGGNPPEGWTGQYVHQITATFRTRDDEGNYELSQRTMGIKSSSVLSPFEAAQAAMGILETPVEGDDDDRYGGAGDLLGLSLTGAWYDINPSATKAA